MYSYLKALENSLSEEKKDIIKRIYAPIAVTVPLADSRRDVCIMPDGEIRSYGKLYTTSHTGKDGVTAYLSSHDCGLSWEIKYSEGKMNSCTYFEKEDIYITVCDYSNNNKTISTGLYVYRSKIGPDDASPEIIKLSDEPYNCSFLPQQSAFSDRIWFTTQVNNTPVFFYSDDFGKTWTKRSFPAPHNFETVFPHKGLRWCNGSGTEPYVTELSENKMMMIIRTPMDCFYQSFSYDGGDSWTTPEPSCFYGTNTTAFLLRLSDGRIISFWNNTKPLSQPNHNVTTPFAGTDVADGMGENAFTNRDAAHAAISENHGESWIGYREIFLNPIRNNSDFRYLGGTVSSMDKSVHQFQAYELPFNKVLVSVGQNVASRRIIIFDIDWLYEKNRKENFTEGLGNISTHTYLKSISGSHCDVAGNGHCAKNRTYSAYPMPNPDGGYDEVLYISKKHDERLINDIGGACWNFPASHRGSVTVDMKLTEKQAKFILTDRWYNTCDHYAATQSPFWFELDVADIGTEFVKIKIDFDTEKGIANVFVNENPIFKVRMTNVCPTGISYIIFQCDTDGDSNGFYIRSIKKTEI